MRQIIKNQKAVSKTLAAVLAIVIIGVAAVAVYFAASSLNPSTNPTPTPSPTASPTEQPTESPTESPTAVPTESPSPSPSPTVTAIENFTAGAVASYNMTLYKSGALDMQVNLNYSLVEGSLNESAVWLFNETSVSTISGVAYETVSTWFLNKTDLSALQVTSETFADGVLLSTDSYVASNLTSAVPLAIQKIDPSTYTGTESVTVQAGTFVDCDEAQSVSDTGVTTTWVSSQVPFWGIVKQETYTGSILTASLELVSYS